MTKYKDLQTVERDFYDHVYRACVAWYGPVKIDRIAQIVNLAVKDLRKNAKHFQTLEAEKK